MAPSALATMNSRTGRGPRGPSRGGIAKSRSSTPRIDKDGDLDMGSGAGKSRGSGRGASRGAARGTTGPSRGTNSTHNGPGLRSRTTRPSIVANRLQEALQNTEKHNVRITKGPRPSSLVDIRVTGWKNSKASTNSDGGVKTLIQFLERKASSANETLKITKSRNQGDSLIISVRPEWMERLLHLNGFEFAGVKIGVEAAGEDPLNQTSSQTNDLKANLTNILKKRYNPALKILNLSELGQDPDLLQMGILESETTVKKFFPALMKMADTMFETSTKKEEMVDGVTLAGNRLQDLELVTTLAVTFPDLKKLDLSNNEFKTMDSLKRWQWKLRKLEHVVLAGNEVDQLPDTRPTLLKWYPRLSHVDNDQVRSPEELNKKLNPIPVQPGSFRDEQDIAANFLTAFFPLFDDNRDAALQNFYDAQTNFSFNVNTGAPRDPTSSTPSWDAYIKKSRNLLKINHLPARMSRLAIGAEAIRQEWAQLPKTRHPSLTTEGDKWLVECHVIPGLPDPTGSVQGGVGGLLIMTHSSWDEIDVSTSQPKQKISFDRTFVLGPGGNGGIRVISDIICLRAFGGSDAWKMQDVQQQVPQQSQQQQPEVPPGFGQPAPGKTEDILKQELMILEICIKTRLKLDLAKQCLEMNGWDMDKAFLNFQELKANNQIPEGSYW